VTRCAAAVLAVLALAGTAGATVRVFVTASSSGYGLEDPANHMLPTASTVYADGQDENAYDYANYEYLTLGPLRPGSYPPYDAPSGTVSDPVAVPAGDWAYVWLQFQQGEPKGAQIVGLQTAILESGITWDPNDPVLPPGISTTHYLCNNAMLQIGPQKRWAGMATPPDYPEWHNNPQDMAAYGYYPIGVENSAAADPPGLYSGVPLRMALLGAVEAPADGRTYQVLITSVAYATPPDPAVSGGYFRFLEPCVGDLNCDGVVDLGDINPFVQYLSDGPAWQAAHPTCPAVNGDIDGDGTYGQWSFGDINPFVTLMSQAPFACP
jgi:hypothetical protein